MLTFHFSVNYCFLGPNISYYNCQPHWHPRLVMVSYYGYERVWIGLTDWRQKKNITDYRQNAKKMPTTDMTNILTDYRHGPSLSIFVFRKKSISNRYWWEETFLNLWPIRWSNGKKRISSSIGTVTLLQPISKSQKSHLQDTTDLIHFIEKIKMKKPNVAERFLFRFEKCLD